MRHFTKFAVVAASLAFTASAQAASYKFDPTHTEVRFYYNHAGLTEQSGEWKVVGGEVEFDPAKIEETKVSVTIDPASVDTGVEPLDEHLKGSDFFDAEKFPEITFVSTSVKQTGATAVTLVGDLTIRDQKHPVELDFQLKHNGPHPLGSYFDYYQGQWIGVEGKGAILRSDFGVGKFAPLTSDRVRLEISAEMREGGW
ncbi:Protein YceI [Pseudovibrio sp. W64]|uniref:YceI family protein n=1 Tax=unclassified Pseudovibrio TaxID=2627060 RepID=UPI0007AE91F7|nr:MULTISPECIES: YceI family protein [unclassified Pseudovibrio]KZK76257.1 Protein YceI [Pseudovibrio sp. W64]KZK80843.1 Protein YceI [Pseudovibrio sp. Ad46]KZL00399.1 Protein YceI [Pseudovibrio sp. W74]KZL07399.1 Protein YceI [Pseudovibrio sp. Ad14]